MEKIGRILDNFMTSALRADSILSISVFPTQIKLLTMDMYKCMLKVISLYVKIGRKAGILRHSLEIVNNVAWM